MKDLKLKQEISGKIRGFDLEDDLIQLVAFLNIPPDKATANNIVAEAFKFAANVARETNKNNPKKLKWLNDNEKSLKLSLMAAISETNI